MLHVKTLSTLDIAKLTGMSRMHAFRLAPTIPGARRARPRSRWRFPDSPELQEWIGSTKARLDKTEGPRGHINTPKLVAIEAKFTEALKRRNETLKRLCDAVSKGANSLREGGSALATMKELSPSKFRERFLRPNAEEFQFAITYEKARAMMNFAARYPVPFTPRKVTQKILEEFMRVDDMT